MTEITALDRAHERMETAPEDTAARMGFYERLADCELFLLLEREPEDEMVEPRLFPVGGDSFALVFDRETRLADFAEGPAPYAALPGRLAAQMLAGQGIGLGVNLGVAPSAILIPPEAVDWLAEMLPDTPDQMEAQAQALGPPRGLPEAVVTGLDAKLAAAAGLADMAYLAGITYADGAVGHMLAFIDAAPGAEAALARAVNEALAFSGVEAGELDVSFFRASDPVAAQLARVGLRFDLPQPAAAPSPAAPGMDPDKPPRLR